MNFREQNRVFAKRYRALQKQKLAALECHLQALKEENAQLEAFLSFDIPTIAMTTFTPASDAVIEKVEYCDSCLAEMLFEYLEATDDQN